MCVLNSFMNFLESNKEQFNCWAKVYDSFFFRLYFEPLYRRLISIIEKEAGNKLVEGGAFLDVACGTGEILSRLAKTYPKSMFYGVDLAPEMIESAKRKAKNAKYISFQVGNVDTLPFEDSMFDIVLCSEAFHHFEHPEQALKEIRRTLKPDAIFLLMDPAYDSWLQKILVNAAGLFETSNRVRSQKEFLLLLQDAGFSISHQFIWHLNNFFIAMKHDEKNNQ